MKKHVIVCLSKFLCCSYHNNLLTGGKQRYEIGPWSLTLTPTGYSLSTLLNATECSVPKHEPCQMQQYAMGNSAIT